MKRGNIYGKGQRGKATELHARIVRARGYCERCGSTQNLQCCHVMSRSYSATRTDENAAFCGCAKCHFFLTNNPFEHVKFCTDLYGIDGYEAIRRKAYGGASGPKMDWDAELARLRAVAAGLAA